MAVFTPVTLEDATALLRQYDPSAELLRLEGIGAGIENTNYFLTCRLQGQPSEFVLTLFETLDFSQAALFADMMNWWAQQGFPVPAPRLDATNQSTHALKGKPTLLIPRLHGQHILAPCPQHCRAMGTLLARMHRVAAQAPFTRPVERTLDWMRQQQQRLQGKLLAASEQQLAREIDHYARQRTLLAQCPAGLVHGDLFRDNVLFEGNDISGLIDFYHSGWEVLLFDLAVVANDWCRTPEHTLNTDRLDALLEGYRQERPWTSEETRAWPHLLRLAALRFWLARLVSRHLPGYQQRSVSGDKTKDPSELEQLLVYLKGSSHFIR